jgi:polar amino acid transport system substrate-binding protein
MSLQSKSASQRRYRSFRKREDAAPSPDPAAGGFKYRKGEKMLMVNRSYLMIVFIVLLLGLAPRCIAAEKVYINGIDPSFPPFAYVDKSGVPEGFDVKSLDWIAREMGFKVKHQPQDWDSIISSLVSKKIDIVASGMKIKKEREKQVAFTIPYWKIRKVLVVPKASKITAYQALSNNNMVGVQRGTSEAKWIEENLLDEAGRKFTLVQYDSVTMAVADLINGRIVAAAMDDVPAKDAVRKKPVKILGTFGMPEEDFGYAVRKEDKELLKKLNDGLEKLMKSPHWKELIVKYDVK